MFTDAKLLLLFVFLLLVLNVETSKVCDQKLIATGHVRNIVNSRPKAWPWVTAVFNITTKEYLFSGALISREHVLIGKENFVTCRRNVLMTLR